MSLNNVGSKKEGFEYVKDVSGRAAGSAVELIPTTFNAVGDVVKGVGTTVTGVADAVGAFGDTLGIIGDKAKTKRIGEQKSRDQRVQHIIAKNKLENERNIAKIRHTGMKRKIEEAQKIEAAKTKGIMAVEKSAKERHRNSVIRMKENYVVFEAVKF